ncbi:gephyrin-like molybdotransferase Glp [Derxia gummosa]|uniref:Molybdopterin molybdenumtransferase n=1 Tax=Derxia gummosa DSM 723 TaxID=1121388 RepID=A0A8B6X6Z7_9BURK|nr:gephyrin-like molybdotransferase Glp [Derxia gummosa]
MTTKTLDDIVSCLNGYDPDALGADLARQAILDFVRPVAATETVPLRAALGRILAADVTSPINVPGHDNSAMDGYAFAGSALAARAADAPLELLLGATLHAGAAPAALPAPDQCLRIMTGAVIPSGCDTVVPQEFCELADTPAGRVMRVSPALCGQLKPGDNVRLRGEDLATGSRALAAGRRLRPADLGLLASLGIAQVEVKHRLRVAFFSTGDELVPVGEPLRPGAIYDSNGTTIAAMLARLGVDVIDLGNVRDDPALLEAALRRAAGEADAVITSGGVSVGEADFTKQVMARCGEVAFWKMSIRPGRPMAFGRIWADDARAGDGAVMFGLPGNPVAVMATFYCFVRDALLTMAGEAVRPLPRFKVPLATAVKKKPGRTEFQRVRLVADEAGVLRAHLTGAQGSGILRSMSEADGLIVLPQDQGGMAVGELVDVIPFEGLV